MNENSENNNLMLDKICLDQALVQQINICHELRKQALLKDKYIEDINSQIQTLLEENKALTLERDILKSSMQSLASQAQSIEG